MKTIFVVRGTTGEYSDRYEWIVTSFVSEQKAKEFVVLMDGKAREVRLKVKELESQDDFAWYSANEIAEKYFPEIKNFDTNFNMDYTGTNYFYDNCELDETP